MKYIIKDWLELTNFAGLSTVSVLVGGVAHYKQQAAATARMSSWIIEGLFIVITLLVEKLHEHAATKSLLSLFITSKKTKRNAVRY